MRCDGCGGPLTGRQRRWCSEPCRSRGRRSGAPARQSGAAPASLPAWAWPTVEAVIAALPAEIAEDVRHNAEAGHVELSEFGGSDGLPRMLEIGLEGVMLHLPIPQQARRTANTPPGRHPS